MDGTVSAGTLFVVGTPIGNLGDLSSRAVEVLEAVDVVYAEDTRRTGRLLRQLGSSAPLRSLHEHNERRRENEVLDRLAGGGSVALVSDAGTPTVSDPGRRVIAAALARGLRVTPVPGPSAVPAALSVAGLPADRFWFAGFPPRRGRDREAWMARVEACEDTVVAFEAPGRLAGLLADLADRGIGTRAGVVCRELTKLHETVHRGAIGELATVYDGETVKGEVTLVIAGAGRGTDAEPDEAAVRAAIEEWTGHGLTRKEIAARLEERFELTRNEAYEWSLAGGRSDD